MQFAAASWLIALVIPPLLWLAIKAADRRADLRARRLLGEQALALREHWYPQVRGWQRFFFLLGLCWLVLALARPQWGASEVTVTQRGNDVVIALDVSRSMLAQDVAPSRLERAKTELTTFLRRQTDSRVGLVLFAGAAFVQCPLTMDLATAEVFLQMAAPDMISAQGTALATALRISREVLLSGRGQQSEARGFQAILLVTDGEDLEGAWEAEAQACRREGITIIPVGIGEETGGLIPLTDDQGRSMGFLKDDKGDLVLSRLDLRALDELASIGGGSAFRVGLDGLAGERLRTVLERLGQRDFESRRVTRYQERYHWPLALALAHLMLAWSLRPRRRSAAIPPRPATVRTSRALLLAALLLPSLATQAAGELLRPHWAPSLERGRQAYARQDYETALLEFEQARAQAPDDPRLALAVGETLYRLERLEEAALEFERARSLSRALDLRAESLYNAGTTALTQDDPEAAVDLLRESLRLEPERSDALHNLEAALLRLQEQQEQQEQQQEQQEPDSGEQDQDDQNEDQDEQQPPQPDSDQQSDENEDSGEQPSPLDMTPEEAEAILDALEQLERELLENQKKESSESQSGNERDW